MGRTRTLFATAAAFATTAAVGLAGTQSASATDYYYDGKNPASTVCANDARTVYSKTAPNGELVELRYSNYCHTAWARLTHAHGSTGSNGAWGAWIHRNTDGKTYACTVPSTGTSCFTAMVYDKDPLTSYAKASGDDDEGYFTIQTPSY